MIFLATAWAAIGRAASGAWRAITSSRALQLTLAAAALAFAFVFGVDRAIKRARKAGYREGRESVLDKIEKDSKNVLREIKRTERDTQAEIGPPVILEDRGDGEGLTTDQLNQRQLERLQERANNDPRNRGNPRSTPRDPV